MPAPTINELTRKTDPDRPNTDDDLTDGGVPWLDGGPNADPAPLSTNPAKGPLAGTWTLASLTGMPLSTAGSRVQTPAFELCGPNAAVATASGKSCTGTTGYYRATWQVALGGSLLGGAPVGRFEIAARRPGATETGDETLLSAYLPRERVSPLIPIVGTFELYFAASQPLQRVQVSFVRDTPTASSLTFAPLFVRLDKVGPANDPAAAKAAFLAAAGTPGAPNGAFHALAIPGRMLTQSAALVDTSSQSMKVPSSGGSDMTLKTDGLSGGVLLPPVNAFGDFMARFAFSTGGALPALGADQPIATAGVVTGTPRINSDTRFFDAAADTVPLAQGHVFTGDLGAGQRYVNLAVRASASRTSTGIRPALLGQPQSGGLQLDNVVLQRIDSRAWVGTTDDNGNVLAAPQGPWSGYGFPGRDLNSSGATPDAVDPGTMNLANDSKLESDCCGAPWPNTTLDVSTMGSRYLTTKASGSLNRDVPVTHRGGFDQSKWLLAIQPLSGNRCSPDPLIPKFIWTWVYAPGAGGVGVPGSQGYAPYTTSWAQDDANVAGTQVRLLRPATYAGTTYPKAFNATEFGITVPKCPAGFGTGSGLALIQAMLMQHPN